MDSPPETSRFVAYPRAFGRPYGTVERLEALGEGYFGINRAFGLMMLALVFLGVIAVALPPPAGALLAIPYMGTTILVTLPHCQTIYKGKGRPQWAGWVAAVLIALTTPCFFGVFGCFYMQMVAVNEIQKYGAKPRNGFTKKRFQEAVQERRELDARPVEPIPSYEP